MRARRISARIQATPEELESLLALLERERNSLIEQGAGETPLGRALWASTDAVSGALKSLAARKEERIELARVRALGKPRPDRF